ncbi:hypothetical protein BH23ACT4_BH23ACT4_17210 [soil metagenome]
MADITEHPSLEGKVYLAVVIDAWSRRVIGWSIADQARTELVVDALDMACWRRKPASGQVIHHADHGTQGGFNWSSQHLDDGGNDGTATRMDARTHRTISNEVTRSAVTSA